MVFCSHHSKCSLNVSLQHSMYRGFILYESRVNWLHISLCIYVFFFVFLFVLFEYFDFPYADHPLSYSTPYHTCYAWDCCISYGKQYKKNKEKDPDQEAGRGISFITFFNIVK